MRMFGRGTGDIEISFKGQDFNDAELVYVDPELDFSVLALKENLFLLLLLKLNLTVRKNS